MPACSRILLQFAINDQGWRESNYKYYDNNSHTPSTSKGSIYPILGNVFFSFQCSISLILNKEGGCHEGDL